MTNTITRTKAIVIAAAVLVGGGALTAAAAPAKGNADKVDGFHATGAGASINARKGKLVATASNGRLPNNIIVKAPDADKLDGKDSSAFATRQTPLFYRQVTLPGRFKTLSSTSAVVVSATINVANNCGPNTRHQYLMQASGFFQQNTASAVPRLSLNVDSSAISFGPGFTVATTGTANTFAPWAATRVVNAAPGAHTFSLNGDMFTGTAQVGDPTLVVTDLGYNCAGGPTPRTALPRTGSASGR